jgi:predicted nucleic acid-binding protein
MDSLKKSTIIADSTTLITLINIDHMDLLAHVFKTVYISGAVYNEVTCRGAAKKVIDELIANHFIQVHLVNPNPNAHLLTSLMLQLDPGESESIILAIETNKPLIIDEKKGRSIAKTLDVHIIGLVGILYYLKTQKIVTADELRQILDKMKAHNFRISKNLVDYLLG